MRQHGKAETNHRRPAKVPFDLRHRTGADQMPTPAIETRDREPIDMDPTTTGTDPADDRSNQQLPKLPTRRHTQPVDGSHVAALAHKEYRPPGARRGRPPSPQPPGSVQERRSHPRACARDACDGRSRHPQLRPIPPRSSVHRSPPVTTSPSPCRSIAARRYAEGQAL